jgi:hypothetical protein
LAGEHCNGRSVRFNWIQRRKTHQGRLLDEDQRDELVGFSERWCMAVVSSYCKAFC